MSSFRGAARAITDNFTHLAPSLRMVGVASLLALTSCAFQQVSADYTTANGTHVQFKGNCDAITGNCLNAREVLTQPNGNTVIKQGYLPDPTQPPPQQQPCQLLVDAWGHPLGDTCGNVFRSPYSYGWTPGTYYGGHRFSHHHY